MEKTNLNDRNAQRQAEIDKMIKDGQLGTMTECAYGQTIGDLELAKKINKDKENETDKK